MSTPTDTDLAAALREHFPAIAERASQDHPAFDIPQGQLVELLEFLRDSLSYGLLVDITAIDWSERSPRFSCVYHLYNPVKHVYVRIASDCTTGPEPSIPSVTGLWAGANWHERETYDMFGITFAGHPDLTRILMWEGYPYFPLRKEFPLAGIEVELPAPDIADRTGAKVTAAPMMGGPFHAVPGEPMSRQEPRARDQSWTENQPKPDKPS